MKPHIFYLHGFASSPASTKARFFEERLADFGLTLRCPDLNTPDFETVTIGRMVAQVEREILSLPPAPTVLFGSSLGAMVAVELASRWASRCSRVGAQAFGGHAIERLVLLAPALDFARSREHHLGQEGLEQWRAEGSLEVFHHGEGRTRRVHYAGERISHQESLEREERYLRRGQIWCFVLNRRWVIDGAVDGNIARFINHSCTPNCYAHVVGGTIWIRAARKIAAGEELTYDYHTDGDATIACRCRPDCDGRL